MKKLILIVAGIGLATVGMTYGLLLAVHDPFVCVQDGCSQPAQYACVGCGAPTCDPHGCALLPVCPTCAGVRNL
ncbi:MAG: hypothetical protein GY716_16000 [bacterium]|nr:hypothetical protein [bacterium]